MKKKAKTNPQRPVPQVRPAAPSYVAPPPKKPAPSIVKPAPRLRWRLPMGVIVFTAVGFLSLSAVTNARAATLKDKAEETPEDVSDRYHKTAQDFDGQIGISETLMGINWFRSWMTREATGHVLEVGVGTARNSRYFKTDQCESITMIDQAPEMIEIARAKFRKEHPSYKNCRFVVQSVHDPIQHPTGGFDTVLQTMGICSTANPAKALQKLGTIANPKDGRILLLEHGRSYYDWLNNYLDKHAASHADKFGCWWNKDIGKIVRDSGLEVVRIKRYHFGTTWWVELKAKAAP